MISAGYFRVTKETLMKMSKQAGEQFLSEMVNYGGRISHYEMENWMSEMGWD